MALYTQGHWILSHTTHDGLTLTHTRTTRKEALSTDGESIPEHVPPDRLLIDLGGQGTFACFGAL